MSLRRNLHTLGKRKMRNDTTKKGTILDQNRTKGNKHKGAVQLHQYLRSNHYREKEQCWSTVKETLIEVQNGKVILGGDLNLVQNIEEKFGGSYHADPSREALEAIMEHHKLIDIPPRNGKYTWSNKRVGKSNIKERLDRILVQENIASGFNSTRAKILHTMTSNHKLVAIIWAKWIIKGLSHLNTAQYGTTMKTSEIKSQMLGHKRLQDHPIMFGKQN